MLKKQPEIVNTIRLVKTYAGRQDQSGYSDQEKRDIHSGIRLITARSRACYDKFSKLFPGFKAVSVNKSFQDFFQEQVEEFKAKTKSWDKNKVMSFSEYLLDESSN